MSKFYNIKGSGVTGGQKTTELISPTEDNGGIKSVLLTNVHASADATVTIFIQDDPESGEDLTTNTFHFIKKLSIPAQASFILDDKKLLSFDNETYGLYVTVASGDTVDILIV